MVVKVYYSLKQRGSYSQGFLEFTTNISDNNFDTAVILNWLSFRILTN